MFDLSSDIERQTGQLSDVVDALEAALHPAERHAAHAHEGPPMLVAEPAGARNAGSKSLPPPAEQSQPEALPTASVAEGLEPLAAMAIDAGAREDARDTVNDGDGDAAGDDESSTSTGSSKSAGVPSLTVEIDDSEGDGDGGFPASSSGDGASVDDSETLTRASKAEIDDERTEAESGAQDAEGMGTAEQCNLCSFLPQLGVAAEGMARAQGLVLNASVPDSLPPVRVPLAAARGAVNAAVDAALRAAAPSSTLELEARFDSGGDAGDGASAASGAGVAVTLRYTQAGARAHAGGQDGYGMRTAAASVAALGGSLTHECCSTGLGGGSSLSVYEEAVASTAPAASALTSSHEATINLLLPAAHSHWAYEEVR